MASITITFTDAGSEVAVTCDIPGGFDKDSRAHQMANMALNTLDHIAQRLDAPKSQDITMVDTVMSLEDYWASRAGQIAHLGH